MGIATGWFWAKAPAVGDTLIVEVRGLAPAQAVIRWVRGHKAGMQFAEPQAVEAVFQVKRDDGLIARPPRFAVQATAVHPLGYRGPAFSVADHLVWGLTAHLLDAVLDLAGWSRPWDTTREVGIPDRYLRDRRAASLARDDGGPDAH